MPLDFDVKAFVEHIQSLKPPYECPVKECGKIYKSFTGMQNHIYTYDHDNPENNIPSKKPGLHHRKRASGHWRKLNGSRPASPAPDLIKKTVRDPLTYAEAQRMVEVDMEGEIRRINIVVPLDMVTQDEVDNWDNTAKEEKIIEKAAHEVLKTENHLTDQTINKEEKCTEQNESKLPDDTASQEAKPCPEKIIAKLPEASFTVVVF